MQPTRAISRIFAACLLVCVLPACSTRGDIVSEEYMEFELDGQRLVLSAAVTAVVFDSARRVDTVSVGGREQKDLRSKGFFFQLIGNNLRPGTYTTSDATLHTNYHGETGAGSPTLVYAANGTAGTRFTVTLTALDRDGVRGTFSGTFQRQGDGQTPHMVTVSNGRFAARYHVQ